MATRRDRGVQFTSWAFSQKVREAGLAPSIVAVGWPYDNAVVEAFWGRMQVERLNRKTWKSRTELASAPRLHRALPQRSPAPLGSWHAHPDRVANRYFRTSDAA